MICSINSSGKLVNVSYVNWFVSNELELCLQVQIVPGPKSSFYRVN